ncbi:MAG: protein kinase [Bdellovibrionales bacterium]
MSGKPEFFGKYILLDKLAAGGMAEVYLAKMTGAENVAKIVAVKKILPQFSKSAEFIEMFKAEAKIAVNLAHSNIVSIFEFGIESEQFYLAMEYVEGRNLRQILNRLKELNRALPVDQAIYVINEAARGLDHAHRCIEGNTGKPLNIIHRDISPQNLMMSFEGNVKIVDFGIAKAESQAESTRAGTLKGKFSYMSPEQAEGNEVDARTDVFSLGIVLWEILANDRLFLANNEMNTLKKIKECHVPSLHKLDPNIPVDLEKIVAKALARDKNLRYQSAAEFHKDLNSYLNRQFPDFSPNDFSLTLKQLFAEELLESRRKLIEYAKINFNKADDKTVYVDMSGSGGADSNTATVTDTETESMEAIRERLGKLDAFSGKLIENTDTKGPRLSKLETPSERSNSRARPGMISHQQPVYDHPAKPSSSAGLYFTLLLLGAGGYFFYSNPSSMKRVLCERVKLQSFCEGSATEPSRSVKPVATEPSPSVPATAPQPTTPSTPPTANTMANAVTVAIVSYPAEAQIVLNSQVVGTTPAQIDVPLNTPVIVTVRKDGFQDLSQTIRADRSGQTFSFTLAKMKMAYLTIKVVPGGAPVYLNDKKISDTSPVSKLVVPAMTPLNIKAIDSFTNTTGEQSIMLRENTHQEVTIFLKSGQRQPAQRQ